MGRDLSLLSLVGAILDSTPHQKLPVLRFKTSRHSTHPGEVAALEICELLKILLQRIKSKREPRTGIAPEVPAVLFT
jgi:hypothetical protein